MTGSEKAWCVASFVKEEHTGALHAAVQLHCWKRCDGPVSLTFHFHFQWRDGDWLLSDYYSHDHKAIAFCRAHLLAEWSKLIDSIIAADCNYDFSSNGVIVGAPRDA